MTPKKRRQQLFQKFIDNTCTQQEVEELIHLLAEADENTLDAPMKALWERTRNTPPVENVDWATMYHEIIAVESEAETHKPIRPLWTRIAAAASIVLILSIGGYLLYNKTHHSPLTTHLYANDIPPGHSQATLTLANGQKIILRKGLKGMLAQQGNAAIKAGLDAVTYDKASSPSDRTEGEVLNTLTTARGEQSPYPLVLADGTKVWLNAESSLTFPADFKGNNRTVKITGEAYFEVVHNAAKPFRVIAGNKTIEDVGTAFDVNAYNDEPEFKTTVLQGAVKLITKASSPLERTGGEAVRLLPGQQAILKNFLSLGNGRGEAKIISVDSQSAIAWKNGQFRLDEQRLDGIMRQAARWYDVDVVYENDALRSEAFGGVTARYANVSQLLHALELTKQVRFRIDGRKITVMNK